MGGARRSAAPLLDALGLEPGVADIGSGKGGYSNLWADQGDDVVRLGALARNVETFSQRGNWRKLWPQPEK